MGDASITCLQETEEGTLWIGTDCGLFRHDLKKDATTRLKGIDGHVSGMCKGTQAPYTAAQEEKAYTPSTGTAMPNTMP